MKAFLIGPKGGSIDVVHAETGEIALSFPVSGGIHPMAKFRPFVPAGHFLSCPGMIETRGNMETCKPVGQFDSAANPFFRPSPASKQIREMRMLLQRTEMAAKRALRAERAGRRAKAPAPEPEAKSGETGGAENKE